MYISSAVSQFAFVALGNIDQECRDSLAGEMFLSELADYSLF